MNVGTGSFTLGWEMKVPSTMSTGHSGVVVSKADGSPATGTNNGFRIYVNSSNGKMRMDMADGTNTTGGLTLSNTDYRDDTWHKFIVRVDRTTDKVQMTVDGAQDGAADDISILTGSLDCSDELRWGLNSWTLTTEFTGYMRNMWMTKEAIINSVANDLTSADHLLRLVFNGMLKTRKMDHKSAKIGSIKLTALDWRYALMRIYANETYVNATSPCVSAGCETSELVKDLVSTYGQGIFGFTDFVESSGKYYAATATDVYPIVNRPVWEVLVKFGLEAGFVTYVDKWKEVHYEDVTLRGSGKVLTDGTPASGEDPIGRIDGIELDAATLYDRVRGIGDPDVPVLRQSDNIAKQIEWGVIIEDIYEDKNVTDSAVMKEITTARVVLLSDDETESYKISVNRFFFVLPGRSVKVTSSAYNLTDEFLAVQKVDWTYDKDGQITTKLILSKYPTEYAQWFHRIAEEITLLKGAGIGATITQLDKLFYEWFKMADGLTVISRNPTGGFIADHPTYSKAGTAKAGFSSDTITTKVTI
jgi:hypothetical protein